MAKLLDKIAKKLQNSGHDARSREARSWLNNHIKGLSYTGRSLVNDPSREAQRILPGKMFFYFYDPKTKDSLPYYDKFPLVLPLEMYTDGFLGLNLHYIRPKHRIVLLDKLYDTLNNERFDASTKMKINYDLLSGASRFKEFEPCVKRYLGSHIKSRVIEIAPDEWEIAAMLPVEQFVKASSNKVYRDSEAMY